jgi:hypothetical protein
MLQSSFRGDMQAAADWLLECPDLLVRQQCWQEQREEEQQRRLQEQEERRQTKKQIVDRWALLQCLHAYAAGPSNGQ